MTDYQDYTTGFSTAAVNADVAVDEATPVLEVIPAVAPVGRGLVEVTLAEPHTHNGVDMHPGDILTLPSQIADYLVTAGAARYI